MTTRISLSNGGWAELREPAAVPVRLRRPVEKVMLEIFQSNSAKELEGASAGEVASQLDSKSFDNFTSLNDLLIVARVSAWSLDCAITLDSVLDLPIADYELLQKEAANDITEMMPNFSASDDPSSPINPSDA